MDEWLTCQGKWLYLEPIFSADEIMKQIPREGSAFRLMDASWRQIVQQVSPPTWVLDTASACTLCATCMLGPVGVRMAPGLAMGVCCEWLTTGTNLLHLSPQATNGL